MEQREKNWQSTIAAPNQGTFPHILYSRQNSPFRGIPIETLCTSGVPEYCPDKIAFTNTSSFMAYR